ncbi:hypothetical protein K438DRAFT_1955014 [Mycena galopus ATCC 62051]|nr:hypothetical protein K438DRAFT_1955014 [Mycena galopus ATCC 62051]
MMRSSLPRVFCRLDLILKWSRPATGPRLSSAVYVSTADYRAFFSFLSRGQPHTAADTTSDYFGSTIPVPWSLSPRIANRLHDYPISPVSALLSAFIFFVSFYLPILPIPIPVDSVERHCPMLYDTQQPPSSVSPTSGLSAVIFPT